MSRPAWLTRFSRMPIRARLTIVLMAMMATVLAGAGVFLYEQFRGTLDAQIRDGLRQQTAAVDALVVRGHFKAIEVSGNPLTAGCRVGAPLGRLLDHLREHERIRPISLRALFFLIAHGAAAPFTLAPLARHFDHTDPLDPNQVAQQAALTADLITGGLRLPTPARGRRR